MGKTVFISGHLDLTKEEFKEHYIPRINSALRNGANFVVGDAKGCDKMAQEYLRNLLKEKSWEDMDRDIYPGITVYHMLEKPRNCVKGFRTEGGFESDDERDHTMTAVSDYDIAWVRKGREKSGTAENLKRRIEREKYFNGLASSEQKKLEFKRHFYWKTHLFFRNISRTISNFFFGKKDNKHYIQKYVNKYRNQILLDPPHKTIQLLGWTDQYEEDYYYVIWDGKRIVLYSCVGGFTPIEKYLPKKDYYELLTVWNYNNPTIYELLVRCETQKIKVK